MLKKGMEMSSEPYYMGTIISFDATCTGYFTTLKYLKTKIRVIKWLKPLNSAQYTF